MKYLIGEELANAILNYLATKPYIEVAKMMEALQALQPHNEDKIDDPQN